MRSLLTWIAVLSLMAAGCNERSREEREAEDLNKTFYQLLDVDGEIQQVSSTNQKEALSELVTQIIAERGQEFFRSAIDSNRWICINPDLPLKRDSNTDNTLLMYTPISFTPSGSNLSFFIGLIDAKGKLLQTNLRSLPSWKPLSIMDLSTNAHISQH